MPVAHFIIAERPAQTFTGEPALHVDIRGDIDAIVIVNELVANGRQVGGGD